MRWSAAALLALLPLSAIAQEGPGNRPAVFRIASELTPARPLKPGEFTWAAEGVPPGPVVIAVDLKAQVIHVYRGGHEIGLSTISSGRNGFETPQGTFRILEKNIDHYSDTYDLSPMPYMQRLTWDGIALHGGKIPGHRASHGCVRLPQAFAHALYFETQLGGTVYVTADWDGTAIRPLASIEDDPATIRMREVGAE